MKIRRIIAVAISLFMIAESDFANHMPDVAKNDALYYLEEFDSEPMYMKKVSDFTAYSKEDILKDLGL